MAKEKTQNKVHIKNRRVSFEYFVIDCGWYKADGVPWDISMGDYVPSKTLSVLTYKIGILCFFAIFDIS